jgi:hypothetical protein
MTTVDVGERRTMLTISGGEARAIYNDGMAPYVQSMDGMTMERATYVEPDFGGYWYVDLSRFGHEPEMGFKTRSAALSWEKAWLENHWLLESRRHQESILSRKTARSLGRWVVSFFRYLITLGSRLLKLRS